MLYNYDNFTCLQYRIRHLEEKVCSLESGEAFVRMKKGQDKMRRYYERRISSMQRELEQTHKETACAREKWFEVFQDVQDECGKRLEGMEREVEAAKLRTQKVEEENAALKERLRRLLNEVVETRAQVQDEKEKNQTLRAQLGQDFQNSSVPSSRVPFRPKVPNNREKTNRKPGGQPGHEGHCRKKSPNPDRSVFLPAPKQVEANPDYYRQSGRHAEVHKQVVEIYVKAEVTDYWSYQYRNRRTGAKYHPPFPEGVQLEMNYGESVKAFIFLMKNHLNVSEKKISEFLREVSGGKLCVSQGMVNGLNREFAAKTKGEREAIFRKLMAGNVLHTDMTGARMNGKMKNIVVCTDGEDTLYFFRDTKGDKALKGTPVETFGNMLVHDHDKTLYHYGEKHQECNEHHLRYLKGAEENEPGLTWHGKMRSLLKEMNRVREAQGRELRPEQVADFESRYDKILDLADQEYQDNPPSTYYRKGYNLSVELREYKEQVLLFLHEPEVDFTNNKAERACRKPKRHLAVSGTFRGRTNHSGEEYCESLSVLETIRGHNGNVYEEVKKVFQRPVPNKEGEI